MHLFHTHKPVTLEGVVRADELKDIVDYDAITRKLVNYRPESYPEKRIHLY